MNALLPTRPDRDTAPQALPQHNAVDLTCGGALAQIRLGNQIYTLRITRQGKLILTK